MTIKRCCCQTPLLGLEKIFPPVVWRAGCGSAKSTDLPGPEAKPCCAARGKGKSQQTPTKTLWRWFFPCSEDVTVSSIRKKKINILVFWSELVRQLDQMIVVGLCQLLFSSLFSSLFSPLLSSLFSSLFSSLPLLFASSSLRFLFSSLLFLFPSSSLLFSSLLLSSPLFSLLSCPVLMCFPGFSFSVKTSSLEETPRRREAPRRPEEPERWLRDLRDNAKGEHQKRRQKARAGALLLREPSGAAAVTVASCSRCRAPARPPTFHHSSSSLKDTTVTFDGTKKIHTGYKETKKCMLFQLFDFPYKYFFKVTVPDS